MKALSIRQPWADLIVRGVKDVENRTWSTSYRGPLLIHAGKAIMAGPAVWRFYGPKHEWELGGIVGTAELVNVVEDSDSSWAGEGSFHWVLRNARPVDFFPCSGALGLFEVEWPPAAPPAVTPKRRDEKPASPEDGDIRGASALEMISESFSIDALRRIARAIDNEDLSAEEPLARQRFRKRFEGRLHTVLLQAEVADINALTAAMGGTPRRSLDAAVNAFEVLAADDGDYDNEEDMEDGEDEDEDIELVSETGLVRESGYTYFCDDGVVARVPLPPSGDSSDLTDEDLAKNSEVVRAHAYEPEPGFLYFCDRDLRILRKPVEDDVADEDDSDEDDADSGEADVALEPVGGRADVDDFDTDDVMAAFRVAARGLGTVEREDLLRAVCRELGFKRMGNRIEESLRGHLRAAIRRRIILAEGKLVSSDTKSLDDYRLEELRDAIVNNLRRGQRTDRDSAVRAAVTALGFSRLTESMRETMKSALNSAIRQQLLGYEGLQEIWRK